MWADDEKPAKRTKEEKLFDFERKTNISIYSEQIAIGFSAGKAF